jgi:chromosomal replication initiation ATPase DnaA
VIAEVPTPAELSATPTVEEIVEASATEFGVRVPELLGLCRLQMLVAARHVAIFVTRRLRGMSLPELGVAFHQKKHHGVMHAVHKCTRLLHEDLDFHARVLRVETAAIMAATSRRRIA